MPEPPTAPSPGSPGFQAPLPLVAAAAWAVPGLGHCLIGQKARGLIAGAACLALFTAGLLIGGIDVVDSRNDRLWFAGQVLIGPVALVADFAHTRLDTHVDPEGEPYIRLPEPAAEFRSRDRRYDKSIGRMNELGTLYTALAGVLNLLIILDAVGREEPEPEPVAGSEKPA